MCHGAVASRDRPGTGRHHRDERRHRSGRCHDMADTRMHVWLPERTWAAGRSSHIVSRLEILARYDLHGVVGDLEDVGP